MNYYKKKYNLSISGYKNAKIISDNSIALPVAPHISMFDLKKINILLTLSNLDDFEKENVINHLKEWYEEKKAIAYLEEKLEEVWEKVLPILNEVGLI